MIADDYRGIREAMRGADKKQAEAAESGTRAECCDKTVMMRCPGCPHIEADRRAAARWHIHRAREQSERIKP